MSMSAHPSALALAGRVTRGSKAHIRTRATPEYSTRDGGCTRVHPPPYHSLSFHAPSTSPSNCEGSGAVHDATDRRGMGGDGMDGGIARDLTASGNAPTLKRKSNTYKIHHVASRRRGGPYPPPRSSSTLNSAAGRIRPIDLIAVAIVYRVLPVCGAYASRSSCWLLSFPWRRLKVVSWSSNADSKSSADADVADSESSNSSIVADVKSSDGKGEIWERR
ncbi:hypothetical protein BDZ89DRAFT_1220958 [Hymenopellis radicata]|nr:hypothetical protein BDZ89DRAFT_1220958 [Hymenopellis radicata]